MRDAECVADRGALTDFGSVRVSVRAADTVRLGVLAVEFVLKVVFVTEIMALGDPRAVNVAWTVGVGCFDCDNVLVGTADAVVVGGIEAVRVALLSCSAAIGTPTAAQSVSGSRQPPR